MNKKLFNELVLSKIWREAHHVRIVYITMLALSNNHDIVSEGLDTIAEISFVPKVLTLEALTRLSSKDFPGGQQIRECEGGWVVSRGGVYRKAMSKDMRREYQKLKMRQYREVKKLAAEKDAAKIKTAANSKKEKERPKTADVWEAYADAYGLRYAVPPVRNARVNAQLAQFIDRVGAGEAPGIAAYYLQNDSFFYLSKGHPVGLLLMDAEKLRTEFVTGNQVSSTQARHMDKRLSTKNAFQKLLDRVESDETSIVWDKY